MEVLVFVTFIGFVIGSFLGAYTYRYPRSIYIGEGRSKCPRCKCTIPWYDNIPVVSYLVLGAKCRGCDNKISMRYPVIEGGTALLFFLLTRFYFEVSINISWLMRAGPLGLPILLTVAALLIAVLVIDIEHQIIPDETSFLLFLLVIVGFLISGSSTFYAHLLAGFSVSLFLLIINLVTLGRGMGLGDVKLAIGLGLFLGPTLSFVWIFLSFVIGAIVGIFLLVFSQVKWRDHVAFGPFLVFAFFITLYFGPAIQSYLLPF